MTKKILLGASFLLMFILSITSASANAITPDAPSDSKQLKWFEISASSVSPIVTKWTYAYHGLYQGVTVKFDSVNSNNAVYQYAKNTVPVVNSDVPLGSDSAKKSDTLTIPGSIHTVAIVYNIVGFKQSGLKLNGDVLADIYLGKIIYWNDPKIQALNPSIKLPTARITPIHRLDASGITYTYTEYLSSVSKNWKTLVGKGTTVSWKTSPADSILKGEDVVVKNVAITPYSIGYTDLGTAVKYGQTYAAIQNGDGTGFVVPSLESSTSAANSIASSLPESDSDWSKVSIVNALGANSYPIVGFNYILTHKNLEKFKALDKDNAKAIVHQVYWDITDGQKNLASLYVASLPDNVAEIGKRGLGEISFKGSQLFAYDGFIIKPLQ